MSKNRENYVVVLKYPEILPELCYDGRIPFVTDSIEEAEKWEWSFAYDQKDGNFLQIDCPTKGCGRIIESYLEDY